MSKIFLTGGAGFIGSHVIPMLIERGDEVVLFDNMFRGDRDKVAELASTGRVELIDQDVRYGGAVHQAMKGCESVIHFAAVSINKSQADPYESIDINMVGNHNVFAAAADHGVRRLVFASSASVYGDPKKIPMHEDDPLHPLTPYCISKRAGEDLLGFYQRRSGLSWIAPRFFNVYGEGQKTTAYYTSVINHFVARLKNNQPPVIDGKGEQSMDFIHVHDIARATVMVGSKPRTSRARRVSAARRATSTSRGLNCGSTSAPTASIRMRARVAMEVSIPVPTLTGMLSCSASRARTVARAMSWT
jgi:UDP-glucose 4-epimerase